MFPGGFDQPMELLQLDHFWREEAVCDPTGASSHIWLINMKFTQRGKWKRHDSEAIRLGGKHRHFSPAGLRDHWHIEGGATAGGDYQHFGDL